MSETLTLLPVPFVLAAAAGLGACFGSFSNVLIHRLPRNLSVVSPPSACPGCGRRIRWHENVPVLGWLLLRGRCRGCGMAISRRYPAVELAGAACALVAVWRFGPTVEGLAGAVFLLLMLDVALIDWEHMIIPHTLTVGGMVLGLGLALAGAGAPLRALAGAGLGAGLVFAVSGLWRLLRGQWGMGFGDVMLMGTVGMFLGPWGVPAVLFGGALLGTVWALAAGRGRVDGLAKLPFGTFLAAAAAAWLLGGEAFLAWYLPGAGG
ncbi:MAG: prepilin peptidase [Candidatus Krumholzibacteriia bacterium]